MVIRFSNYAEQNDYLKVLISAIGERTTKNDEGRGLAAPVTLDP